MKNTVFTFAVGIAVFGTTPNSAISPLIALEYCIACPPLVVRAVPGPDVKLIPERLEERESMNEFFAGSFDFQSKSYEPTPARYAVSVGRASLTMGYGCRRSLARSSSRGALQSASAAVDVNESRRPSPALALSGVRPWTFQSSLGADGRCWAPAPLMTAKSNAGRNARLRTIRTHVVRRPTGGFDQICQRNPEAIKCALRDPSVITFRRRLGAKLDQDDTMLVGDFRSFTAGVRVIRSFN